MKETVLSGMRPTGKLHLGNLIGALNNWVKGQDKYNCLYMVADWHALTSEYADTKEIKENIIDNVVDWISVGLDPEKSVLFQQSSVLEHAELHLILSMITPLSWLTRCPTYKEQQEEIKDKDLSTYGFLGYPVLQSADILIYKANFVPVGQDQLPHLEITREIARRFNYFYGKIFPEPQPLLTDTPKLPGIDGRKMSKSYNNCIYISDEPEAIKKKTMMMFTDPEKIRLGDPGRPEICPVYAYHLVFNIAEKEEIERECKSGKLPCTKCKSNLAEKLILSLERIQKNRKEILKKKNYVKDILHDGTLKAKEIAGKAIDEVRRAVWHIR